jgi:hypothetical protein
MHHIIRFLLAIILLAPTPSSANTWTRHGELLVGGGALAIIGGYVAKKELEHNMENQISVPKEEEEKVLPEVFESNPWLKANVMNLLNMTGQSLDLPNTPPREKLEVHHLVPWSLGTATEARQVMRRWGISLSDPVNCAILPWEYHRGPMGHKMPNPSYGRYISDIMLQLDATATRFPTRAEGRNYIMNELRIRTDELVRNSGSARALQFQMAMRAVERNLPHPEVINILERYLIRRP